MKVVHILGKFDRGGVEVFLKDVYLNTNKLKTDISFVLLDDGKGVFDDELEAAAAQLYKIPINKGLFNFTKQFYKYIKKNKITVVHSHVQAFSGFILFIAYLAGVKGRVAHSHSEESYLKRGESLYRKLYLKLMKFLLINFSNCRISCSENAGKSLFGSSKFSVVVNGINPNKFSCFSYTERMNLLNSLNLSEKDIIIGHIGRVDIPKNHSFIIDIADVLIKKNSNFKFVLVGNGPLFKDVNEKIINKGLEKNVLMLGSRDDAPNLFINLFDVFLFPSIYEGLPIVLLEAQISGLSCLISNNISIESIVFEEMVTIIELSKGADYWANLLLELYKKTDKTEEYKKRFENTKYTIIETIKTFDEMYNKIV
ncbi:glycosyltransferase [Elizabethkingia meningoseptica]|uniref:glycosyltransferase n=1 Tax=Elizabethkingia meningoseptica TaxID=238 RepID=UPI002012D361|nr:glycosyltransferase [Elizabethkingia meningoseptica]MCL1675668.1 glycosyltransferase [Elizabethkingia meningoseptica]MCL1686916.1 glycosyltransferase [Elizabethkingia meningoseptica]